MDDVLWEESTADDAGMTMRLDSWSRRRPKEMEVGSSSSLLESSPAISSFSTFLTTRRS